MAGVRDRSTGHHPGKILGMNRINVSSAKTYFATWIFRIQAAGFHGASFATGPICFDGRASIHYSIKYGVNTIFLSFFQYIGRGFTAVPVINIAFGIVVFYFFYFSWGLSPQFSSATAGQFLSYILSN